MTVPPYAVAAVVLIIFAFASDKLQTRGIFMAVSSALGGVGYLWVFFSPAFRQVDVEIELLTYQTDCFSLCGTTITSATLRHSASPVERIPPLG